MYDNDPEQPTEELLKSIRKSCMQSIGGRVSVLQLSLPAISALMVKLSNEASSTADKNIKIQNKMIILTSIILAISIVQLSLAFLMFSNPVPVKATVNHPSAVATPQAVKPQNNTKQEQKTDKIIHNKAPSK